MVCVGHAGVLHGAGGHGVVKSSRVFVCVR